MQEEYRILLKLAYAKLVYLILYHKASFNTAEYETSCLMAFSEFENFVFLTQFEQGIREAAIFKAVDQNYLELYYNLDCPHCRTTLLYPEKGDLSFYADSMRIGKVKCLECEKEFEFKHPWKKVPKFVAISQGILGADSQQELQHFLNDTTIKRALRWMKIITPKDL